MCIRDRIKAADELSKADWSMLKDTVRLLISAGVGVVRDCLLYTS